MSFAYLKNTHHIKHEPTTKMSQTFFMLNLYVVLKLQLLTIKFFSLRAELFIVYRSGVSSEQMNAKYMNYLYKTKSWKSSFDPVRSASAFQCCNIHQYPSTFERVLVRLWRWILFHFLGFHRRSNTRFLIDFLLYTQHQLFWSSTKRQQNKMGRIKFDG